MLEIPQPLPVSAQFFELDVYHSDGTPFTSDQIFVQLEKIWNSSLQANKEPVGILTSNHRNTWAKAYNTLIKGASRVEPTLRPYFRASLSSEQGQHQAGAAIYLTGSSQLSFNGPFYR